MASSILLISYNTILIYIEERAIPKLKKVIWTWANDSPNVTFTWFGMNRASASANSMSTCSSLYNSKIGAGVVICCHDVCCGDSLITLNLLDLRLHTTGTIGT